MIGDQVRRRREELGLTGAQLATRAGLAPSAVSQIETGRRTPSSNSVMKLAAGLGVEVGDLYPKKGQAPLPDFDGERRSEAFLQQFPSSEERIQGLQRLTGMMEGYAQRWRQEAAEMEAEGTAPFGRGIEARFFWAEGLFKTADKDGFVDYATSVLLQEIPAAPREWEACKKLDDAVGEAQDAAYRLWNIECENLQRASAEAAHGLTELQNNLLAEQPHE